MPQGGLEALNTQDPLSIKAYQYDLVCNGFEIASGSIRNQLPEVMVKAFELTGKSAAGGRGAVRRPLPRLPVRRPAAWRHAPSASTASSCCSSAPRTCADHAVPDEPAGPGPADGRAKPGNPRAAARTGAARHPDGEEGLSFVTFRMPRSPATQIAGLGTDDPRRCLALVSQSIARFWETISFARKEKPRPLMNGRGSFLFARLMRVRAQSFAVTLTPRTLGTVFGAPMAAPMIIGKGTGLAGSALIVRLFGASR